jgi:phage gp46-like protein
MASYSQDLSIVTDGVQTSALAADDPLARAVFLSLFTWRRAAPDDQTDGERFGWWGDNVSQYSSDQIGSRLWLLARQKLTTQVLNRARDYAIEALEWLVKDGVASRYDVTVERMGINGMAILVQIYRLDGSIRDLRFDNVWSLINV